MMQAARTRIGKVTYRNGLVVHRPAFAGERARLEMEQDIRRTIEAHGGDVAGYAFVVWARDGSNTRTMDALGGGVPWALVPDFVRNCLMALYVEASLGTFLDPCDPRDAS